MSVNASDTSDSSSRSASAASSLPMKLDDLLFRVAVVVIVFVSALYGFSQGAGTENYDDVTDDGWLAWVYYTVSLFVLGGIELGAPRQGGAPGTYAALWLAYYLAPVVTTTVIATTIRGLLQEHRLIGFTPSNHVLVIGTGEVVDLYIQAIHAVDPERLIVQVTHSDSAMGTLQQVKPLLMQITGNTSDHEFLQSLWLSEAFRVVVLSTDDLNNLEIAWEINALKPLLPVVAHVSDLTLLRPAHRMVRSKRSTDSYRAPGVFSTHRIASLRMFDEVLEPRLHASEGVAETVVVTGFDHFSQTLVELLLSLGAGEIEKLVIVDEAATENMFLLQEDVAFSEVPIACVDGNPEHPATWEAVAKTIEGSRSTIAVLATADADKNFRASMLLHNQPDPPKVYLRCFRHSTFYRVLAAQLDTELLCLEDVLQQALEHHYEALAAS